jgi:hypothetical protein
MTRRDLSTTAGTVAFSPASQARILGANDRISVGLIGCGARSQFLCTFNSVAQTGLQRAGIEFTGTEGQLGIDRTKFEYFQTGTGAPPVVVDCHTDLVGEHIQSFLECSRSRKIPNGDVAAGHRSASAAHPGNVSLIEKRRIHFDPERETVLPV